MNTPDFKQKALHWANQFEVCCLLDSNHYKDAYSAYDFVLAAGVRESFTSTGVCTFETLKTFYEKHKEWLFGFFSYDLKNEIEDLQSKHQDYSGFPDCYFFIPEYLILCKDGHVELRMGDPSILNEIDKQVLTSSGIKADLNIRARLSKDQYLEQINTLKGHIVQGDIYEVNFCQEFFAEHAEINPLEVYQELNRLSPTPFGGYFKHLDQYILSVTPERFLCKRGDRLISQPIKGTARRSLVAEEDNRIKADLKADIKEQAENVMIVDLVRHDLTKSAVKGSVQVDELFGVYTFPQVHQMISTISCELSPDVHFIDAIKNAFPMGSMTGAPKVKAMKLIETYEASRRGVYSGSFGCISPDRDFDFNVVIRSILYNANNQYLSFQVGGAITFLSDPQKEYEECLLKASAMMKVLGNL